MKSWTADIMTGRKKVNQKTRIEIKKDYLLSIGTEISLTSRLREPITESESLTINLNVRLRAQLKRKRKENAKTKHSKEVRSSFGLNVPTIKKVRQIESTSIYSMAIFPVQRPSEVDIKILQQTTCIQQ